MKVPVLAAAAVAAVVLAGSGSALAACRLVSSEAPVTMDGLRPLVAAKIGGKPVKLLLDSGAFGSSLTTSFATQEKLPAMAVEASGSKIPGAASTLTSGVRGHETMTGIVIAPTFEFGGAVFPNVKFLTIRDLGDGVAGLVGQNLLKMSDDDYDLRNGVLRLVQPQGCDTAELAYWVKPPATYSVLPLDSEARINAHTVATVLINGEKMRAYFDTGAASSFITTRAAMRAGVRTTDPGVKPAADSHGLDGDAKTWVATFASIKIGDEEIKNAKLAIGQTVADSFDILVGADFFLAHHVYVANSQGKLYFSYEGGPVFRTPPTIEPGQATAKDAR